MSSDQDHHYSDKYTDSNQIYEYRHVKLKLEARKELPIPMRLLTEQEWRKLGVMQSPGWEHYTIYPPEPFVLLFRRKITK